MNTKQAEQSNIEKMLEELAGLQDMCNKAQSAAEQQYKDLSTHYNGVKAENEDLKKTVQGHAAEYASMKASVDQLQASIELVKKELDAPVYRSEADLKDHDRKAAIELQRRLNIAKNGVDADDSFRADLDNLVNLDDFRNAARKLVKHGGLMKRREIYANVLSEGEKKAFDAAGLDTAFFSPEILGLTIDCNVECGYLLDLYGQVNVSRSKFMYPQVVDYGEIGSYHCDVDCDADLGPEGNIKYLNGKTYDWRGVFCFLKKVLEEANYDFLAFMMQTIARSYRIGRNRALMIGDGDNEPEGWLTAECFAKVSTEAGQFNHVDFRRFQNTAPLEYGPTVTVMHQNTFGYLASAVDHNGRFIFGDGDIMFSPSLVTEAIRISNCLPDPTEGNTLGSDAAPFVSGSFIAALANWDMAYKAVNKTPMQIEQFIGGSSKWCSKYQFGAEDGAFTACCAAGRTLYVG
jgi:hypothetical protein